MLSYLLKSAVCLLLFLLFYELLLERQPIHRFKRFYLLSIVAIAFSIPTITFTEYQIVVPVQGVTNIPFEDSHEIYQAPAASPIDWSAVLWTIYGAGALVFAIRFLKNIITIVKRISRNLKIKSGNIIKVLMGDPLPPHTFFNYVFLNRTAVENNQVPKEVWIHEKTHAQQKHSLDLICIEILCIVFWFNPLFFWLRKKIRLNHEFLADDAVLKNGISAKAYQELLLKFSLNEYQPQLANAINYSLIKKRFVIMKKRTSKKSIFLRTLLLLPLAALLIFGFAKRETVFKSQKAALVSENQEITIFLEIDKDNTIWYKGQKWALENVADELLKVIPKNVSSELLMLEATVVNDTQSEFTSNLISQITSVGIKKIKMCTSELQKGASREQMKEYNTLARKYNEMSKDNMHIKMKEVERMKYIYSLMSEKQKADAQPFPDFPEPPAPPSTPNFPEPPKTLGNGNDLPAPPAPPKPPSPLDHVIEMAKKGADFYYEGKKISSDKAIELLKKNNELNINSSSKNGKHTVKISKEPIKIGHTTKASNNISDRDYASSQIDSIITTQDPFDYVNNLDFAFTPKSAVTGASGNFYFASENKIVKFESPTLTSPPESEALIYIKNKNAIIDFQGEKAPKPNHETISVPPAPPAPQPPLDHIIEMAKKGAEFYYEDKKITSDKAIELLKKNNSLNIDSRSKGVDKPVVRISKSPIVIK